MGETEVLFETMCQLQKRIRKPKRILLQGKKISEGEMRVLPEYQAIGCSSQGRQYQKQLARKLTDIVSQLPYEIALEIAETGYILWGAYSAIYSQEVRLDGLELSAAAHRRERLKALGNSIVPQVAAEIMRAIKSADCLPLFDSPLDKRANEAHNDIL